MSQAKAAVILAAGQGKRMNSELPKVLHEISGEPMIHRLVKMLKSLDFDRIVVVVGFKGEMVEESLANFDIEIAWQKEQLGTGHAVMMTRDLLGEFDGTTLVALGDVPFLQAETVRRLFDTHQATQAVATCLSAILPDATGYGRIVRKAGTEQLEEIVEHKDASEEVLKINEVNSGTFCFDNKQLFSSLDEITNENSQQEYYLTDTVKIFNNKGLRVSVLAADDPNEVRGVNSAEQLEQLTAHFQA